MIDPMGLDLGLGPAPTAPEPPQPASRTPSGNQRLVQLALMGLAGGLGPGAGTGILQGMTAAMQRRRQDAAQQDAFAQQQYARQQQEYAATKRAYEVEQQRREQVLQKNLQDFRTLAPTLPDKGAYDRYVDAYTQGLQALGFRLSPNWLRSAVPYTAPTAKDVAAKALDKWFKNPLNKKFIDNPDALKGAYVYYDRDGDGKPEGVPFFEAAEMADMPLTTGPDNKLLAMPKGTTPEVKANADGILQSLMEQDRAEGKPDTPRRRVELQKQAIRMAKDAGDTTPNGGSTPTVGSFEDYVRRAYGPNPTAQQIIDARRAYNNNAGNAGDGAGPLKLSAAQQDDLVQMMTVEKLSSDVEALGDRINWSGVGGFRRGSMSAFAARNMGRGTPEQISLRNQVGNITATIAKLRGGTSFTEGEKALLEQYTPTIDEDPTVIKSKLRDLRNFIQAKRAATLKVASGDLTPLPAHGGSTRRRRYDLNGNLIGEE